jgi:hypothetical protein
VCGHKIHAPSWAYPPGKDSPHLAPEESSRTSISARRLLASFAADSANAVDMVIAVGPSDLVGLAR